MKHLLLTTIAAVLLVGCGPSVPDISIHDAATEGDIEAVKKHLAAGTDVNAKATQGFTPLHYAVMKKDILHDHKEIVELLINNDADVNAKDGSERTPLHLSAMKGQYGGFHIKVVELFIAKGADVNAKDDNGKTPLDVARHPKIADHLRKHGGKTGEAEYWKAEGNPTEPVAEATKPEPPTVKAPDISIHKAAEDGNIEAVKQHLAAGADVNAKDDDGGTPLLFAAMRGHKEIAELLIAEGAEVNAKDEDGGTPLHYAAHPGHKEIAELLIAKGANVNAEDEDGATALDKAIGQNNTKIADLLRKHGGKTGEELKAEGK